MKLQNGVAKFWTSKSKLHDTNLEDIFLGVASFPFIIFFTFLVRKIETQINFLKNYKIINDDGSHLVVEPT